MTRKQLTYAHRAFIDDIRKKYPNYELSKSLIVTCLCKKYIADNPNKNVICIDYSILLSHAYVNSIIHTMRKLGYPYHRFILSMKLIEFSKKKMNDSFTRKNESKDLDKLI